MEVVGSGHARCEVYAAGGMLVPLFRVPSDEGDGEQWGSPLLAAPPWEGQKDLEPPILRHLRGSWTCVPFGARRPTTKKLVPPQDGALTWRHDITTATSSDNWNDSTPSMPHGPSSNVEHTWQVESTSACRGFADYSRLTIDEVGSAARGIASVEHHVRCHDERPRVDVDISVNTSETVVRVPIGLHPVVNTSQGSLRLRPPTFRFGFTFPGDFEPGRTLPFSMEFSKLSAVPGNDAASTFVDLTVFPRQGESENLVQLCGVEEGVFMVDFLSGKFEGKTLVIRWDPAVFPSVLLWMSNRGRTEAPWSSEFLGLGIEPIASAFDLGTAISVGENPISKRGVRTSAEITGKLETSYSMELVETAELG